MVKQTERGLEGQRHEVALRHALCASIHPGLTTVWHMCCISHLIDVHAAVTGQRASRCQVIGTEESGDDAVLVHLSDCGAVNKINQAILVHGDAC